MLLRRLLSHAIFPVAAVLAIQGFTSCKSAGSKSAAKDITLSPTDLSEPIAVVWQTADGNVHYGLCPSSPASRTCGGLKEDVKPVDGQVYKDKLTAAILNMRPKQKNSADGAYSEINLLRTKIKRMSTAVAAGSLTASETASFNAQIAKNTADLQKLSALDTSEQKTLDTIMNSLQTGQDVTFDEGEDSFTTAIIPFGLGLGRMSSMPLPPPGTKDNKIDKVKLLEAWNESAELFYGTNKKVYATNTSEQPVSIDQEPITNCLGACPPYFSELTCHFYCWHPSYKRVSPNVRGCFTSIARDQLVKKPNGQPLSLYPEVFDYCMYQEFDQAYSSTPGYDESIIAQRKSSNRKSDRVGVLKFMTQKQEDAFKYVMFNWYNPFAWDAADEQDIINQFYAAHPAAAKYKPTVNRATKALHPRYAPILSFMQNQYASGGFGPIPPTPPAPAGSTAGTATTCGTGGNLVDGYCWYLGALGESCDQTCSKASLSSSPATVNYVGSGGSDTNCSKVAAAFSEKLGAPSASGCVDQGCAKCDATCAAPLTSTVFRCSSTTTTTASKNANVQPFCACN